MRKFLAAGYSYALDAKTLGLGPGRTSAEHGVRIRAEAGVHLWFFGRRVQVLDGLAFAR